MFSYLSSYPLTCALFAAVIFAANVLQVLTGFAGVMLSLPAGILLVGPDMAKASINVLSWIVNAAVAWQNRQYLDRRELMRIISFMAFGTAAGIALYGAADPALLIPCYGALIIAVALKNLLLSPPSGAFPKWAALPVLFGAGVIHGLFVSGGTLLVIYLAAVFRDKHRFRANASAVWVALNLFLMVSDYEKGLYNGEFLTLAVLSLPALAAALLAGNAIHDRIDQKLFDRLTYGLLVIAGTMILL